MRMTATTDSESQVLVLGSYRCELKKGDDGWIGIVNGKYFRLSNSAYYLLRAKDNGVSSQHIAAELTDKDKTKSIRAKDVDLRYREVVEKIRAFGQVDSRQRLPWGYWFRFPLIPQNAVDFLASPFKIAFSLPFAALALAACATLAIAWRTDLGRSISTSGWIPAYLLFLGSLVFHEFGHAAASLRYGIKPKDIGFTLYLIYPALYADVTPVWELGRWKRAVVDLGGCYLQIMLGAIYLIIYHFTLYEPLRVASIVILYSIVFSLNPVFRFDGYWLLADLLDVPNLSRQPMSVLRYILTQLRRRPGGVTVGLRTGDAFGHGRSGPKKWLFWILVLYSVLSISVWTRFILHLTPSLKRLYHVTGSLYGVLFSKSLSIAPHGGMTKQVLELLLLWIMLGAGPARMISRWFPLLVRVLKRWVSGLFHGAPAFLRRS
jgi:hypothetical protein